MACSITTVWKTADCRLPRSVLQFFCIGSMRKQIPVYVCAASSSVVSNTCRPAYMSSFKQKLLEELKAIGIAALYFGCWIAALI